MTFLNEIRTETVTSFTEFALPVLTGDSNRTANILSSTIFAQCTLVGVVVEGVTGWEDTVFLNFLGDSTGIFVDFLCNRAHALADVQTGFYHHPVFLCKMLL